MTRDEVVIGAGLVGLVLLWAASSSSGSNRDQVAPRRKSGDGDGRAAAPSESAESAEVETDEVRALGRVIHSEAGNQSLAEKVAVAWVARNRARRKETTIAKLACSPCGRGGRGRPFSTRLPPRPADLAIAAEVLGAPLDVDPTRGADAAFEPQLQDQLVAEGRAGYNKTADQVRASWGRERDNYGTVGRWELYGPKRGDRVEPAEPASIPA